MKNTKHKDSKQLTLFDMDGLLDFVNTPDKDNNTFSLFDNFLIFLTKRSRDNKNDKLEAIRKVKGQTFKISVTPALIGENRRMVLPGEREELIECAIRKIATDRNRLDPRQEYTGTRNIYVEFSIYELGKVLKEQGHEFRNSQLIEGLQVLAKCDFTITTEVEGPYNEVIGRMAGGVIEELVWRRKTRGDKEGRQFYVSLRLNPLLTHDIMIEEFRPINFKRLMGVGNMLARRLYMRISHYYRQASHSDTLHHRMGDRSKGYGILLSTIIQEHGLSHSEFRKSAKLVRDALKELSDSGVLSGGWLGEESGGVVEEVIYDVPERKGGRPKMRDVKFYLFPSYDFVEEIIEANKKQRKQGAQRLR